MNPYKKKELAYNIARYIDSNILELNTLKDVYNKFPFARSYLSTIFKNITGQTLKNYLLTKRFEQACVMLINENRSITETAKLLNYSSVNNFSRAFKEYFNMSPQRYLQLNASNISSPKTDINIMQKS